MRALLLIVLIAIFPLRGFASVGMQTGMGTAALHQAMTMVSGSSIAATEVAIFDGVQTDFGGTCCAQCNACDLCHLLVGQTSTSLSAVAVLRPSQPESPALRFASADRRAAHKPPLSLI